MTHLVGWLDDKVGYMLIKSVYDVDLGKVWNALKDQILIQKDVGKLEKWWYQQDDFS